MPRTASSRALLHTTISALEISLNRPAHTPTDPRPTDVVQAIISVPQNVIVVCQSARKRWFQRGSLPADRDTAVNRKATAREAPCHPVRVWRPRWEHQVVCQRAPRPTHNLRSIPVWTTPCLRELAHLLIIMFLHLPFNINPRKWICITC